MTVLRLAVCVAGVYAMFLLWAIAQERLSVPFATRDGLKFDKFKSALIMSTAQSLFSVFSSFLYIMVRRKPGESVKMALGLQPTLKKSKKVENGQLQSNGLLNGHSHPISRGPSPSPANISPTALRKDLLLRCFHCALFITFAAPFGFAALNHISYPTMVLGKSCKLVPVLLMNVFLYRRKFARYKYVVVVLVTAGITMFMGFGKEGAAKAKKGPAASNSIGVLYLLINLAIDGATNSTQDEIFDRYNITGQQMMFWINIMCTLVTTVLAVLPLPYIPVIHPSEGGATELGSTLRFLQEHPGVLSPLLQFAFTGSLGQLFIFETLQHFGSLTLVTVTLTRKMFTMVLSVIVYNHKLELGQWVGAGVVFSGITLEAWIKRKDVHAKRVIQEKEKAEIKDL